MFRISPQWGGWGSTTDAPPLPLTPEALERRLGDRLGTGNTNILTKAKIDLARTGTPPRFLFLELPINPADWNEQLPDYLLVENYPMLDVRKMTALSNRWIDKGGYVEVKRWAVTDSGD